jgi:hypothetical protein
MRRLIQIAALQLYAFGLAAVQALGHVRTDEAKYLLDIPYPHPPLGRGLFHLLEGWIGQELFWRMVIATLVVQGVWLVSDLCRGLPRSKRVAIAGAWILSAAVVLQAGTIMMAPLTALQGLLFVWMLLRPDLDQRKIAGWVALLWFASLMTAYQGGLYLPIVVALLWRSRLPLWIQAFALGLPLAVLALYTITNPLALASMVNAGTANEGMNLLEWGKGLTFTWAIGGSIVLGPLALIGMILGRRWALLLSLFLVSAYIFVSFREYYAILLTPLFLAGAIDAMRLLRIHPNLLLVAVALCTVGLVRHLPLASPNPARAVLTGIAPQVGEGPILIEGSFGHEWQYESPVPIRRYHLELLEEAQAVVCLQSCNDVPLGSWRSLPDLPVETWVRN